MSSKFVKLGFHSAVLHETALKLETQMYSKYSK